MNYPAASGRTVKRLRNENAPTKRGITPYRGLKKSLLVSLIIIPALFLSVFAVGRGVTISEIAWAGSADNPTAEWIELYNSTDSTIDLSGWRLVSSDGTPDISLSGSIDPHSYIVLHRAEGRPSGDGILTYTGALRDGGEGLHLYDAAGEEVDSANAQGGAWPAGSAGDTPHAMERIDENGPDSPDNWGSAQKRSADGCCYGTPGERNSLSYTPPQASFTFTPDPAHPDEAVHFAADASVDPSTSVSYYAWNFDDGAIGRGQTFSHTYVQTGSYSILLTVGDDRGGVAHAVKELRVIANTLPCADFSVRSQQGRRVLQSLDPLLFIDESYDPDGEIVSREWDFGDGTTSSQQSPSHTYVHCGDYVVGLDVTDDRGEHAYQTRSLRIESIAPVASYTFPDDIPNVGSQVIFDASGSFDRDGSIASYAWDMGDNGSIDYTSTLPTASLSFPHGGTHRVALQVTDDCGVSSLPFVAEIEVNYPPTPAFQVSNFYPKQAEAVQFTDQSHDDDGTISSWRWDFGDGASSSEESPQHAYNAVGTYSASLTVTDDNGSQATISSQISVANIPPTAHVTANGAEGKSEVATGDTVMFDGSKSQDDKDPVRAGKIVSYHWDLDGDGKFERETTSPSVTTTYPENGTYKVRLQVVDDSGATALSNQVTIIVHDRPPCSSFTFSPNAPTDADEVVFSDASSDADGTITSWEWSFGDGTTSTEKDPHHTFPDDGTYEVSLTVTDDDGEASASCTKTLSVTNAMPVAVFDPPTGAHVGDRVTFHDRSYDMSTHGRIVHVAWDFGDGTFCPGSSGGCDGGDVHNPIHAYASAGTYAVRLVVIDDDGALSSASSTITISE